MPEDLNEALRQFLDKEAVIDVVKKWSTSIDSRNWALMRSIFTDTIRIDYSSNGSLNEEMPAEKWINHLKQLEGLDATLHMTTNHVVTIDGDKASCISYVNAMHFLREGEKEYQGHACGVYNHSFARIGKEWKCTGINFRVAGRQSGYHQFDETIQRGRAIYAERQKAQQAN